ncbi:MAG TPA: glucose 1-dehydrogenase [Beutenbergiaceae bacterium]|nr:glucose 1-dehydrogenase [Beutenbergiaceae bacterium]
MSHSLFDLSGRTALVTGSSRGLGRALARGLIEHGAQVILHGRDAGALEQSRRELAEATGAEPGAVSFDVTDPGAIDTAMQNVISDYGVPHILVNNAGMQRRSTFNEFDPIDWDQLIAANLSSVFYVSRAVTPAMAQRGSGKVINIGSVMSKLARPTIAPYGASKGGVVLLTQGMAADLAQSNIQVNALSPGYFATEMNEALVGDEKFSEWIAGRTPAGRWGRPEELVGTLVYLASDAANFVSGQNVFVDGGITAVV